MNHEELKSQLMGAAMQPFIKSLFDRLHVDRGGTLYNSFEEVSLRRPLAGGQSRTSRADVVTFISTGAYDDKPKFYNRANFSVVFEVKATASDLDRDEKYVNYLSCTDFFFFAVPTGVCAHALYKVSEMPNVGVFDIQRGIIVKMPEPQTIVPSYYMELLEQVTYCQRRNSGKRSSTVDA